MKQKLLMTLVLVMMLVLGGKDVWGQSKDTWTETFDDQTSNTYNNTSYVINGRTWTCKDAGNFSYGNTTMGSPAFVINDDKADAHITTPVLNTCGSVSFKYAYKSGSSTNVFILQKSNDGINYTDIDTHVLGASSDQSYVDYTFTVNDASTTVYIRILSDDQNAHLFVENYTVTDFSGNPPPSITNITQTPTLPNSTQTVSVSADITDDGTVAGVELHWGTASGVLGITIAMSNGGSGDVYTTLTDIPAQSDGTIVYYEIAATDDEPQTTTSPEQSYTVVDPIPTIALSVTSLSGFTYVVDNGPSAEQTFTVEGSNLTNDISIAATTNYEISESSGSGYTSPITLTKDGSGAVASTTIYVRLKAGLPLGDYNSEDITATSTGADPKTVTCSGSVISAGSGGGLEDFTNSNATASYSSNSFVGNNDITWTYIESRDGNGDANGSGINLPALMLRQVSDNSSVTSGSISGGIGNFSVKLYKGFTGGGDRQVELFINGISKGTSTVFDDYNEHIFTVDNIDISGDIILKIANITSKQVIVDDISWTGYTGGGNPPPSITNITQTPILPNSTQTVSVSADITDDGSIAGVELHWGTTSGSLGTTIAMSGSGDTFTTDTDIPAQAAETTVYYEIQATDDNSGVTTTSEQSYQVLSDEPSAHVTSFTATANSATAITVSWTDSDAGNYLVKGSFTSYVDITAPIDGVEEDDALLVKNIASGIETVQFTGLTASTPYYFKIFPYNGTGATVNYKTNESIPEATATTSVAPTSPTAWINEFHYDNVGTDVGEFVEVVIEKAGDYTLADFQIDLYNGNNGASYDSQTIDLYVVGNINDDFTFYYFDYTSVGIQNGAPDGLALSYQGTLISGQFLSYEGSFVATDGPAIGVTSTDIGVSETSSTPSGESLQLGGYGNLYSQFYWQSPLAETPGATNNNQTFGNFTTWTGGEDSDWTSALNWNNGVPDATQNVIIPAGLTNYPTLTTAASCNNLAIESTSSGDASILGDNNLTVNGSVSVERYITGGVWHDLSASTQGQTVNNLFFNHNPDVWLNSYHELTNTRLPIISLTDPLPSGAGFEIWVAAGNNVTVSYDGALQTTDVTLTSSTVPPLSFSGAEPFGYNLIGNPFASALDWDLGTWSLTDITDGIWVWNGTTYLDWVGGTGSLTEGIIPMGQGFFVQATSASPSITIPMDARVHSSQSYYKGTTTVPDHMWIKAIKGEKNDQLTIVFAEDATVGYDNGRDSRKMLAFYGNAPQIYAIENQEKYGVDGLPTLTEAGRTVHMMYHVGESGEQQLLANLESLPDTKVLLEDIQTGIIQDLNENAEYVFEGQEGDDPNRFALYFNPTPTTINNLGVENNISIYAFNNQVYIQSKGTAINSPKRVIMYDMFGRIMLDTKLAPSSLSSIPVDIHNAPIVVKVVSSGTVVTAKVVIN